MSAEEPTSFTLAIKGSITLVIMQSSVFGAGFSSTITPTVATFYLTNQVPKRTVLETASIGSGYHQLHVFPGPFRISENMTSSFRCVTVPLEPQHVVSPNFRDLSGWVRPLRRFDAPISGAALPTPLSRNWQYHQRCDSVMQPLSGPPLPVLHQPRSVVSQIWPPISSVAPCTGPTHVLDAYLQPNVGHGSSFPRAHQVFTCEDQPLRTPPVPSQIRLTPQCHSTLTKTWPDGIDALRGNSVATGPGVAAPLVTDSTRETLEKESKKRSRECDIIKPRRVMKLHYDCGHCGVPKKGHVCPFNLKM
jgi:hypothetical protein